MLWVCGYLLCLSRLRDYTMAAPLDYVKLVKQILLEHSRIKPAHGDIDMTVSFDDERATCAASVWLGW